MVNKEFIRDFQKEIILGNFCDADRVIKMYELGYMKDIDLLTIKKAISWTIMEQPMVSINLSLGDEYGKLLKYVINDDKLNKLDEELEVI